MLRSGDEDAAHIAGVFALGAEMVKPQALRGSIYQAAFITVAICKGAYTQAFTLQGHGTGR